MPGKKDSRKDLFLLGGESILVDDFIWRRWVEKDIPDMPRKPEDDFPVMYPPEEKIVQASKELGLFNTFRLPCHPCPERIKVCEVGKYYLLIDLFRATLDYQRPGVKKNFPDFFSFLENYYDGIFNLLLAHPEKSWGVICGEMDSCCPWPEHFFRNKKEAYQFWKKVFFSQQVGSNQPGSFFSYLRRHRIDYRKANLMVHAAMLFALHHYYHWGFRFVWLERGCGLSNLQLGVAFLRGAARQYNGRWGFDFSTHHPHRNQPTWYDKSGQRRGGWTESLMIRSWMTGFLSGANLIHQETSSYTHWIFDEKGNFRLSPAGKLAKKFADFTLRKHPQRGKTITPIALVLNFYHGFDSRHSILLRHPFVWGNRVPVTAEDWQIANLFDFFFPGHSQSWGGFDEAFNPRVFWKSQWEYLQMLKEGYDMRPYETGHLVNSAYGDCVDVFVDTAGIKTLTGYKLVFLAGKVDFSSKFSTVLDEYVKDGGTIIAAVNQLPEKMLNQLGVQNQGRKWEYDLLTCTRCGEKFGGDRYEYFLLQVPEGKILGRNHLGQPLVWESKYKKGTVILTGVPFSQDIAARRILPLLAHIYGRLVRKVIPVIATPQPIQLIANQDPDFFLVGALNNSPSPWKGCLHLQFGERRKVIRIQEIWKEEEIFTGEKFLPFSFSDTIAPFDFKIYKIFTGK